MGQERRNNPRFPVAENAYVAFGGETSIVGPAYDISLTGVAFEYICDGSTCKGTFPVLELFVLNSSFKLHNMPCGIVYDTRVSGPGPQAALSKIMVRRCGLQFVHPKPQHIEQIRHFLQQHTFGPQQ
ncbi:PilZ domain-containing protein [Thermodesulfobacteriota bacterium]